MDSRLGGSGGEDRRKPVTPQKPSLSASFLEQKRRLLEQGGDAVRPRTADSTSGSQRWRAPADSVGSEPDGRQEMDEVMVVDPTSKR